MCTWWFVLGVGIVQVQASSCCLYDFNGKDQARAGCSDWAGVPGAWTWNDAAADKVSREPGTSGRRIRKV